MVKTRMIKTGHPSGDFRGEGILPLRPEGVSPSVALPRRKQEQGQDAPATQGRDALATMAAVLTWLPS